MAVTIRTTLSHVEDVPQLISILGTILRELEDQLNSVNTVTARTDLEIPTGTGSGEGVMAITSAGATFSIVGSDGNIIQVTLPSETSTMVTNFLGFKTGVVTPVLADFPNANNWGFFTNTATSVYHLVANFNGVIKKVALT